MVIAASAQADANAYAGIYYPVEVAGYLLATMPAEQRPPTSQRVFRWIRRGLVAPEQRETPGRDVVIDFEDLVTCQAITLLREAGFTLREVLKAEVFFAGQYGIRKPFAYQEFWYSGGDIFGRIGGQFVAGNRGGQIAFDFIRTWLKRLNPTLGFAEATGLARCWEPTQGITLRPNVQFGQPCLEASRIPTRAVWSYVNAGDSPKFIARSYGIGVAEVERAVAWENRVRAALDAPPKVPARPPVESRTG